MSARGSSDNPPQTAPAEDAAAAAAAPAMLALEAVAGEIAPAAAEADVDAEAEAVAGEIAPAAAEADVDAEAEATIMHHCPVCKTEYTADGAPHGAMCCEKELSDGKWQGSAVSWRNSGEEIGVFMAKTVKEVRESTYRALNKKKEVETWARAEPASTIKLFDPHGLELLKDHDRAPATNQIHITHGGLKVPMESWEMLTSITNLENQEDIVETLHRLGLLEWPDPEAWADDLADLPDDHFDGDPHEEVYKMIMKCLRKSSSTDVAYAATMALFNISLRSQQDATLVCQSMDEVWPDHESRPQPFRPEFGAPTPTSSGFAWSHITSLTKVMGSVVIRGEKGIFDETSTRAIKAFHAALKEHFKTPNVAATFREGCMVLFFSLEIKKTPEDLSAACLDKQSFCDAIVRHFTDLPEFAGSSPIVSQEEVTFWMVKDIDSIVAELPDPHRGIVRRCYSAPIVDEDVSYPAAKSSGQSAYPEAAHHIPRHAEVFEGHVPRQKAVEQEVLKRGIDSVKAGDEVYIKSSTGFYVTESSPDGYALLSKTMQKGRFRVTFDHIACSSSQCHHGMKFQNVSDGFSYDKTRNYLYGTTGKWRYVAYMGQASNTKQLFSPQDASTRAVIGDDQVKYTTPMLLVDCFVGSVLCACECRCDAQSEYLCTQYENAVDYFDKKNPKHCMDWLLEKAEPRR